MPIDILTWIACGTPANQTNDAMISDQSNVSYNIENVQKTPKNKNVD
jgi:hypothetical protein